MKKYGTLGIAVILIVLLTGALSALAQENSLTETITTTSGLSVNYPNGWLAAETEAGGVDIVNSDETLARMQDEESQGVLTGQAAFLVLGPVSMARFAPVEDVAEIIQATIEAGARRNETLTYGDLMDVVIGEWDAVRVDAMDEDTQSALTLIGFKVAEDELIFVTLATAQDEFAELEPLLLAMANSITYDAPEDSDTAALTETFTAVGMTVNVPKGWIARVGEMDMGIELANGEDTLTAMDDPDAGGVGPGQVAMFITAPISPADVGGAPVSDVVPLYAQGMATESEDAEIGELTEFTIGEHPAWLVTISEPSSTLEGAIVGLEPREGVYLIVVLIAHTDELADSQPLMLDIIGSVVLEE